MTPTTVKLSPVLNAAARFGEEEALNIEEEPGMFETSLRELEAYEEGVVWVGCTNEQRWWTFPHVAPAVSQRRLGGEGGTFPF